MSSVALILLLLTQSTYRANFNLDSWVLGWLCGGCVAPAAGGDSCCPRRPVPVTSSPPPPLPQSIVLLISKYTFKYNRSTEQQWAADTWHVTLPCFHVPIVRFCQPAATCHTCNTCNVAQIVAFQTVKQEHRKSFLPCRRHLAAPSYIINNTSSSIYHINDQHFNCSIFSLFSSSVAHCHWLHNSKLNSPHHTPAAQMTPGSHTEGHMISAV